MIGMPLLYERCYCFDHDCSNNKKNNNNKNSLHTVNPHTRLSRRITFLSFGAMNGTFSKIWQIMLLSPSSVPRCISKTRGSRVRVERKEKMEEGEEGANRKGCALTLFILLW